MNKKLKLKKISNISVAIKVRPLSQKEKSKKDFEILEV